MGVDDIRTVTFRTKPNGVRAPVKRIGEIFIELGHATKEQIDEALSNEQEAGTQLGVRLLRKGIINEVQLAHAISVRLGIGFTDLSRFSDIDASAVQAVPERIARRYGLIPLKVEDGTLAVAMSNPGNVFTLDTLQSATGLEIKPLAAPERAIRVAIDRFYGIDSDLASTASELASADVEVEETGDEAENLDVNKARNEADNAPVIKYVDSLISHAIHDRASDIHIEPGRHTVSVRVRVDGLLRPVVPPPKTMASAVISRIKILSSLDIAERRLPLDGRLRVKVQGREIDLRVSTMPTVHGEKVVLRVLDKGAMRMDLDKIGAEPEFVELLQDLLRRQTGMILITGPTGSGKTTTLYAGLNHVRDVTRNVVSVEDPVEYEIEGVTQVPARADIGMTFARALRSILRQDPDVIMVGEMRDLETLEIGIRAALTGHLVLSTLHTNDAAATVTRMFDMGAESYLIASTLLLAVAQRLVRAICPECKEEYALADDLHARAQHVFGAPLPKRLWRGKGCALCAHSGFYGRTAVFEHLLVDDKLRGMISRRATEQELRQYQRQSSSGSLVQVALSKATKGITTVDEALQLQTTICPL